MRSRGELKPVRSCDGASARPPHLVLRQRVRVLELALLDLVEDLHRVGRAQLLVREAVDEEAHQQQRLARADLVGQPVVDHHAHEHLVREVLLERVDRVVRAVEAHLRVEVDLRLVVELFCVFVFFGGWGLVCRFV